MNGARSLAQRAIVAVEDVDGRFFDGEADTMTPLLQRLAAAQGAPAQPA